MTTPETPVLDLGHATVQRRAPVRVEARGESEGFTGSLMGVDMREGEPFTAQVWDGRCYRHVYVERVVPV